MITALIVLVPIVVASTVIYILATNNNRLVEQVASLMDEVLSTEKELKAKDMPALYIEDTWCDETRPLPKIASTILREIKTPALVDMYEIAGTWLRDPSLLADLRMVLETSRGVYSLYLDEVPDDLSEATEFQVQFDSIVCGRPLEIYACFVEFKGFRLGDTAYKGNMSLGDELHFTYTLVGEYE